jgi:hypothetical protein
MEQTNQMILTFRCPPGLEAVLPRPIPAVTGLPDWFKTMPLKTFNPTMGGETQTVKKCPPFIDAMTYGFPIPLAIDLEVRDGEANERMIETRDAIRREGGIYRHQFRVSKR